MPATTHPIKRRKPDKTRRETILKVLITEGELAEMKKAAQRRGLGTSTWMRLLALDALRNKMEGVGND